MTKHSILYFIYAVDEILNYNGLYRTINEEIVRCNGHGPALVSWIAPEQVNDVFEASHSIESIPNPTDMASIIPYPKANFSYFVAENSNEKRKHVEDDDMHLDLTLSLGPKRAK